MHIIETRERHTGLANDTGIALVIVQISSNVLPELLEDEGASSEVKGGEVRVGDHLADNLSRRTRNELEDTSGQTSLFEDLVDEVVGVCGGG